MARPKELGPDMERTSGDIHAETPVFSCRTDWFTLVLHLDSYHCYWKSLLSLCLWQTLFPEWEKESWGHDSFLFFSLRIMRMGQITLNMFVINGDMIESNKTRHWIGYIKSHPDVLFLWELSSDKILLSNLLQTAVRWYRKLRKVLLAH